jgi:hypothetical protein
MENEIKSLMEIDVEPVHMLSGYLHRLQDNKKGEFWAILKDLSLRGNEQQKFIALSLISLEGQDELQAILLDEFVITTLPTSPSNLLSAILRMIINQHRVDLVPYCQGLLKAATLNDDIMIREMAFRTILALNWKIILKEFAEKIQKEDIKKIIDTMAFFKHTHTKSDWDELLNTLLEAEKMKVQKFKSEIDNRCNNHYDLVAKL